MADQATFLMCSPRGNASASYSLGSYATSLLEEKGLNINEYHIYKTLRNQTKIDEMIKSFNDSDIIVLSSPLYIDSAPTNTIKIMDILTQAVQEEKIGKKRRLLLAISCAGYLEYYHNNIALQIYEQFAKVNGFTWAGGLPIGAAGTYALQPIANLLEQLAQLPEDDPRQEIYGKPTKIIDSAIKSAVEYLSQGKVVPKEELQKLEFVAMPLEAYVEGGNKNWISWAEELGTVGKLRDKPYEKKK
ncbi:MAG: hypothetical protein GPJ50_10205 [Candidatus Heimdallarchaeota archaeon]|nr:hypothetical protein [Candidatus Heimdallarchaeota archaeon]